MNHDKLTTILGLIGGALIATSASLPGALAGNAGDISKLAGADPPPGARPGSTPSAARSATTSRKPHGSEAGHS